MLPCSMFPGFSSRGTRVISPPMETKGHIITTARAPRGVALCLLLIRL